jgi:amidase
VDSTVRARFEVLVDTLRAAGVAVDTEARPAFEFGEAFDLFLHLLRLRPDEETTHADWLRLDQRRQAFRDQWAALFERYDVLLCPVCSTPPFPHDQRPREERQYLIDGQPRPMSDYVGWVGVVGMAYLPSTSTPLGANAQGLPVGVQVVGPHLADRRTIAVAHQLGEVIGGFTRPQGY